MRGRKPKPTEQRRLEGNPGHRPLNEDEPALPVPAADFDDVPPELVDDVAAAATWRRLAPLLRTSRQISEADRDALLALCSEWSRYLHAKAEVARLGLVVRTPSGYPIPNPYLAIQTKALAGCNKLWPELGLTPSSRSRVKAITAPATDDPFAEFDAPPPTGAPPGAPRVN